MQTDIHAVALPASASGQVGPQAAGQRVPFMGYSVREVAGAAAVIRIRFGGVITGKILATIALATNASDKMYLTRGINGGDGLYVELVTGTMPEGSVYYG